MMGIETGFQLGQAVSGKDCLALWIAPPTANHWYLRISREANFAVLRIWRSKGRYQSQGVL